MPTRRLVAIMFSDIVGYTALMHQNEEAALQKLNRYKSSIEAEVPRHQGEIIQYYGDGCLMIFPSAVQAAQCGQALQREFLEEPNIPVRIGIHMGDILQKEGNIYGDAVNVASRVESMGVPGAVLFSQAIRESIKSQAELAVKSLGSFQFKNVQEKLEVYALATEGLEIPNPKNLQGKFAKNAGKSRPKLLYAAFGALLLLALGIGFSVFQSGDDSVLEDDPFTRLVVMPFDVQGTESIQYLGRGMVDLLSAKLDGVGPIRTVDPNMVFAILGESEESIRDPHKAAKLFQDQRAKRIVLGNVVQLGQQLQFHASLYDQEASLIDRVELTTEQEADLPAIIDELVRKLVSEEMETEGLESESMAALSTTSLEALKYYLEGESFRRKAQFDDAFDAYQNAVRLDEGLVLAWVGMSHIQAWGRRRRNERLVQAMLDSLENRLPPKQRAIKRGWDAFRSYNFDRLEAIYTQGIKEYGEDVEFLRLYGEYLFHANMRNLRSQTEAKPYFIKALKFQPDNQELRYHLIQIYNMEGNRKAVDSLAKLTPRLSNNWPATRLLQLMAVDSVDNEAAIREIVDHKHFSPRSVWITAANGMNLPQLDTAIRKVYEVAGKNYERLFATQQIIIDGARGRAPKHIPSELAYPVAVLLQRFLGEPNFALFEGQYEIFRDGLIANSHRHRMYEKFVLATYHAILQDETEFWALMDEFEQMRGREQEVGPVQAVLYFCKIYWYRGQGDNEQALLYLDSALQQTIPANINTSYDNNMGNLHIIKAEILFEQGEYEEALKWYQTIFGFLGTHSLHAGLATYRIAKCLDEMGKGEEALPYYDYFIELYQDSDPKFSNWMSDARAAQTRRRVQ